jgi:tetratricopeptide (TPR) repeat protein
MSHRIASFSPISISWISISWALAAVILCVNTAAQKPPDAARQQQDTFAQGEKIKTLNQMLQQAATARQAGDYPKAVSIMQAATRQDPSQDVLWGSLGQSYLDNKQYPEAIEVIKKAMALNPERHQYHNLLGTAYLRLRRMDDALGEFRAAIELNDKNPSDPKHGDNAAIYCYNAGAVLTIQGKPDEAIAAFDKAIAADPKKAEAYYQKGINLIAKAVVDKDGRMSAPAGTEAAFRKYLELSPNGQFADTVKQMLAMIGAKIETQYGTAPKGKK